MAAKRPQVPTEEELDTIRTYVLLPMMLTIVTESHGKIERSSLSLRTYYAAAAEALLNRIHADLSAVRKYMREHDIKVYEDEERPFDRAVYYRFVCRGYHDRFAIHRDVARTEISVRLGKYVAAMFRGI